jgi:hypothetical protein
MPFPATMYFKSTKCDDGLGWVLMGTATVDEAIRYTETTRLSAAEILEEAANRIDRFGWCQQAYSNPLGEFCLMGAATKGVMCIDAARVLGFLQREIFAQTGLDVTIPEWNDEHCTSKEEAVEMLRMAAKRALAEEGK